MYKNSSTYTWWDIEDGISPLASQATSRWEALRLPKDATEHPVVLKVWKTHGSGLVYTLSLFYENMTVYTAEGSIETLDVPPQAGAAAAKLGIFSSAVDLVGESTAESLVKGLLAWLR